MPQDETMILVVNVIWLGAVGRSSGDVCRAQADTKNDTILQVSSINLSSNTPGSAYMQKVFGNLRNMDTRRLIQGELAARSFQSPET